MSQGRERAREIVWKLAQRPDENGKPQWGDNERDSYFEFPDVIEMVDAIAAALDEARVASAHIPHMGPCCLNARPEGERSGGAAP